MIAPPQVHETIRKRIALIGSAVLFFYQLPFMRVYGREKCVGIVKAGIYLRQEQLIIKSCKAGIYFAAPYHKASVFPIGLGYGKGIIYAMAQHYTGFVVMRIVC